MFDAKLIDASKMTTERMERLLRLGSELSHFFEARDVSSLDSLLTMALITTFLIAKTDVLKQMKDEGIIEQSGDLLTSLPSTNVDPSKMN